MVEPTIDARTNHYSAKMRLLNDHTENGWVVSRWTATGEPEHVGDSLIWTGLTMAVLSCPDGERYERALLDMLEVENGAMVRYEPLPKRYRKNNAVTWDGVLGVIRGLSSRLLRCDGVADVWRPAWQLHMDFREAHGGRFHDYARATVPPGFPALHGAIRHALELGPRPSRLDLELLNAAIVSWAGAVTAAKQPAYRLNLAWLAIRSMEDLGYKMPRAGFCTATRGARVPTIDNYCGRGNIREWVEGFTFNKWEFRHQRSGAWETPDGKPGLKTPALDLLLGLVEGWEILEHGNR